MQFSQIFLVASVIASATAAPTGNLEARTSGGIQCQTHEGKWKYGWEGVGPEMVRLLQIDDKRVAGPMPLGSC